VTTPDPDPDVELGDEVTVARAGWTHTATVTAIEPDGTIHVNYQGSGVQGTLNPTEVQKK
jgi:hypothetical protein